MSLVIVQVHTQPGLGQRGTRGRTARQEFHVRRAAVESPSRVRSCQLPAVRGVDVEVSQTRTHRQTVSGENVI